MAMMGDRQIDQAALFYEFSIERHVPADHMLRAIDRFVDLEGVRARVAPFYSPIGRPSIDPELLIRMLIVGYCFGIRSERRLCEEVHLNLAYRWFCRLGLDGDVPDHSTFSKNRHGRFRDCDLLRHLFETVVERCMTEGLVGGAGGLPPEAASRAIEEYLAVLDDAAFGGATPVVPKFLSPADPAARWTGADKGPAYFAYSTNYLIDLDHAVIVDVEATTAIRQAEVGAVRTMIERVAERHDLQPARLAADTAYGSAEMLDWLVNKRRIAPHIPVIDKSGRDDGTFARSDFTYDPGADSYRCPAGKTLKRNRRAFREPRPNAPPDDTYRYRAAKADCDACPMKDRCSPNTPARKVTRSIYEGARDLAREIAKTDAYVTSRRERKKVEMLFAHLKRILRLDRLRLRGPNGARDEFHLAATAQNLRKLAKLVPPPSPAAA
jgi:transposase